MLPERLRLDGLAHSDDDPVAHRYREAVSAVTEILAQHGGEGSTSVVALAAILGHKRQGGLRFAEVYKCGDLIDFLENSPKVFTVTRAQTARIHWTVSLNESYAAARDRGQTVPLTVPDAVMKAAQAGTSVSQQPKAPPQSPSPSSPGIALQSTSMEAAVCNYIASLGATRSAHMGTHVGVFIKHRGFTVPDNGRQSGALKAWIAARPQLFRIHDEDFVALVPGWRNALPRASVPPGSRPSSAGASQGGDLTRPSSVGVKQGGDRTPPAAATPPGFHNSPTPQEDLQPLSAANTPHVREELVKYINAQSGRRAHLGSAVGLFLLKELKVSATKGGLKVADWIRSQPETFKIIDHFVHVKGNSKGGTPPSTTPSPAPTAGVTPHVAGVSRGAGSGPGARPPLSPASFVAPMLQSPSTGGATPVLPSPKGLPGRKPSDSDEQWLHQELQRAASEHAATSAHLNRRSKDLSDKMASLSTQLAALQSAHQEHDQLKAEEASLQQQLHRFQARLAAAAAAVGPGSGAQHDAQETAVNGHQGGGTPHTARVFMVGGFDGAAFRDGASWFQPSSRLWGTLPRLPGVVGFAGVAELGGRLFLLGGGSNRSQWRCDVLSLSLADPTATWQSETPLAKCNGSMGVAALGGVLYSVGGGLQGAQYDSVEWYDPQGGGTLWRTGPSMQEKRFAVGLTVCEGALYAAGGYNGSAYSGTMERLDPRVGRWESTAGAMTARGSHACGTLGRDVYAIGGHQQSSLNEVQVYDVRGGGWRQAPDLVDTRAYVSSAVVGDALYAIGGMQANTPQMPMKYASLMEVLRPAGSAAPRWELCEDIGQAGMPSHLAFAAVCCAN